LGSGLGIGLGIYWLPILTEPDAPDLIAIEASQAGEPLYTARFDRERAGSDYFHWGEGDVRIYESTITFKGELAPGPDYRLYLAPRYVENEAEFLAIKARSLEVGSVKTFSGFAFNNVSPLGEPVPNNLVIWCEPFDESITSAGYRSEIQGTN
jgi:hypothetical protein